MSDSIETPKDFVGYGMLFLFDIYKSTEIANHSSHTGNRIFYKKIKMITDTVVSSLNSANKKEIICWQSTGDGYYLFCEEPVICIDLWRQLTYEFNREQFAIRCGASFGKVSLEYKTVILNSEESDEKVPFSNTSIGCNLGNVVARCCNFPEIRNALCITSTLYDLIKSQSQIILADITISRIEKPNLKGLDEKEVFLITEKNQIGEKEVVSNIYPAKEITNNNTFVGRDLVLKEGIKQAQKAIFQNHFLNIYGVSGVGKTTLAICIADYIDKKAVWIDLRQVKNARDFHRVIIDGFYRRILDSDLDAYIQFSNIDNTSVILETLKDVLVVFDHAEMLLDEGYSNLIEILKMLYSKHIGTILTSTCCLDFQGLYIDNWELNNPSDDEKVAMLSHWIIVPKREWINDLSNEITNHSFLICLVGKRHKGTYSTRDKLRNVLDHINEAGDVTEYLSGIIALIPEEERFWIYLAYLCSGSIYSSVIPPKTKKRFDDLGLIKEIGVFTTFHPLIMKAVEEYYSDIDFSGEAYNRLSHIRNNKCKTIIEFYRFLCSKSKDVETALDILINNWQAWSEEIDSYRTQALIENIKAQTISDKVLHNLDLYTNIIRIFQGQKEDLTYAIDCFNTIWTTLENEIVIRLLSRIEAIECERKLKGPEFAVEQLISEIDVLNQLVSSIDSKQYHFYGKYYYLGTAFFLIGNILRSLEDDKNAIQMYRKSSAYIEKCEGSLRNALLQKVHISYGIAESYLKTGQYNIAIELSNETIRTNNNISKFGIGLLHLLNGRAYLCPYFSSKTDLNYKNGLSHIKKARSLFEEIHLPYYIQRCYFVEASYYAKTKQIAKARKILVKMTEHPSKSIDLMYRVEILSNYILGITGVVEDNAIETITTRKGRQIGLFYQALAKKKYELPREKERKTIIVDDGKLKQSSFVSRISDETGTIWFVD